MARPDPTPDPRGALLDLLDFHREIGVDALAPVAEGGVDRFAAERARREAARAAAGGTMTVSAGSTRPDPKPADRPTLSRQPLGEDWRSSSGADGAGPTNPDSPEAVMAAREAAGKARSLEELKTILDAFEGVSLKHTAKRLVFSDGEAGARVMLIGEKPGAEEDQAGVPFCGRSGMLLDRMLAAIGLARGDVYIANIVPWRPPANRTPTPQEVEILRPFTERQIALVAPKVLVALGGPATNMLMRSKDGILKTRGRWQEFHGGGGAIPTLPMLHPAYLLRQPLQKRVAWADLLLLRDALARLG